MFLVNLLEAVIALSSRLQLICCYYLQWQFIQSIGNAKSELSIRPVVANIRWFPANPYAKKVPGHNPFSQNSMLTGVPHSGIWFVAKVTFAKDSPLNIQDGGLWKDRIPSSKQDAAWAVILHN